MVIYRRNFTWSLLSLFLLSFQLSGQNSDFEILFYNTENFFDTLDNPNTLDEDFTPNGRFEYTGERFETKAQHLAKVINSSVDDGMPELIGLCEVENEEVIKSLIDNLHNKESYNFCLSNSNDLRGINNALIVHNRFSLLKLENHHIELEDERPTRPVLAVYLRDQLTKEHFWILINHWPSRYGGAEASDWKRLKASAVVKKAISEYQTEYPNAHIIVMGDFNDYPTNQSVMDLVNCEEKQLGCLVNTHSHIEGTGQGSYFYAGQWNMLDQILIGQSLTKPASQFYVPKNSGQIVKHDWMLYESKKHNQMLPNRTYSSGTYYGGYSDHLPVILRVSGK
jgi:predicted extracellular nuclease